jgi:glycosyltransferase involved in cell wall biosynthesis
VTDRYGVVVASTYYHPVLGGAETAARRLVQHLVRRGHPTLVMTSRTSADDPEAEVLDGAEVIRLGDPRPRRPAGKWRFAIDLRRALIAHRARHQLVVCVDFRGIAIGAISARRITGHRVVLQSATDGAISGARIARVLGRLGASEDGVFARAATWPVRAEYRRADAFGCISRAIEHEALAAGWPRDRVHYMPNPVDVARFVPASSELRAEARERLAIPREACVVAFVGRLSREKGLLDLIEAWTMRRPAGGVLLIVGPDMTGHAWDVGQEARARIHAAGLDDSVRFTGGVAPDEVAGLVQAADIAVHPSHFEAFGISAAESMAAGLAVVVTDVEGHRDFARHHETALVVPAHAPAAIAESVVTLAADHALRARLGAAAHAEVQRFAAPVVLESFAQMMDDVVAR